MTQGEDIAPLVDHGVDTRTPQKVANSDAVLALAYRVIHKRAPNPAHDVRQKLSLSRLKLIFDTQTRSAWGFARHKEATHPLVLDAFPAQRFVRYEGAEEKRQQRRRKRRRVRRMQRGGGTTSGGGSIGWVQIQLLL